MRTILIHSLFGNKNRMFDPNERDGYNDPAIYLREKLLQCGYDLRTADDNPLEDYEWVFFNDSISLQTYSSWYGLARKIKAKIMGRPLVRSLYDECIRMNMEKRMVLFLWEAPAICPRNWDPELHKLFTVIFTWHDAFVDGHKIHKIYWPQTRQFPKIPRIPFAQKKLLVNISMNKFSSHPRELYSARRASIRYFERVCPDRFDLFGVGWDRSHTWVTCYLPWARCSYPSYRGMVKNKWDVLPYYRFNLCYENVREEPGYITEKIFDSIRSGCVPIYWGAPNITDYVDKDVFIDRRNFKTNEELKSYLLGMSEHEYQKYQNAIQDYLVSERFAKFLPNNLLIL